MQYETSPTCTISLFVYLSRGKDNSMEFQCMIKGILILEERENIPSIDINFLEMDCICLNSIFVT